MLATGEEGGTIRIWELDHNQVWAICHGSENDVYALEFSPDGTRLASAGRGRAKLWDVATGQFLLDLGARDSMTDLAFSPDGLYVAVGSGNLFAPGGVDVWKLENGRGTMTYRGLTAPLTKTYLSPDGRLVVGLSQDWRIAIWDRATGQLRRMLEVPRGVLVDNSSLVFSPDGRRLAFCSAWQATLWDIDSGKAIDGWDLPPGYVNAPAFSGPDRLLLLRAEVEGGKVEPFSPEARTLPLVCPLRELRRGGKLEMIRVIRDFSLDLRASVASPKGTCFVLDGSARTSGGSTRSVRAYNAEGKELWSQSSNQKPNDGSVLAIDPIGTALRVPSSGTTTLLVEPNTRALVREIPEAPHYLGPGGNSWAVYSEEPQPNIKLYQADRSDPLVTILPPARLSGPHNEFSRDGRFLVWGSVDGTVCVTDLVELNRRLTSVDMGW